MGWILKVTGTNNKENLVDEAEWRINLSLISGHDASEGPPAQAEVILKDIIKI